IKCLFDISLRHAQHRCHRALAFWKCFLHQSSSGCNKRQCFLKGERSCSHKSTVLPKTVPCCHLRLDVFLSKQLLNSNSGQKQRRLCIFRFGQFFFWSFKHQLCQFFFQQLICLLKQFSNLSIFIIKCF